MQVTYTVMGVAVFCMTVQPVGIPAALVTGWLATAPLLP
jgi:hypothetical protein